MSQQPPNTRLVLDREPAAPRLMSAREPGPPRHGISDRAALRTPQHPAPGRCSGSAELWSASNRPPAGVHPTAANSRLTIRTATDTRWRSASRPPNQRFPREALIFGRCAPRIDQRTATRGTRPGVAPRRAHSAAIRGTRPGVAPRRAHSAAIRGTRPGVARRTARPTPASSPDPADRHESTTTQHPPRARPGTRRPSTHVGPRARPTPTRRLRTRRASHPTTPRPGRCPGSGELRSASNRRPAGVHQLASDDPNRNRYPMAIGQPPPNQPFT